MAFFVDYFLQEIHALPNGEICKEKRKKEQKP